jgi:hypothetical protein
MTKPEALQFLAQVATDFLASLPPSAKPGFQQIAQQAIKTLEASETPKEPAS